MEGDGAVEDSPRFVAEADVHSVAEPIATKLGIDYPFPPHLEYAYPPPDGNILRNIVSALIAVPRFYTQVLHLMNKMNLPAPFQPALPMPPLPPAPAESARERQAGDLSSGESELEISDEEDESDRSGGDVGRRNLSRKRLRREPILGPASDKGASHEAAGVKPIAVPKVTAIKKKAPVLQIKIVPKSSTHEVESGKGLVEETIPAEPPQTNEQQPTTASREELEAGKLQASDILSLPIFKKYTPGNPTPVLYIKNLAKDVAEEDMYYIFGAYFTDRTQAMEQMSVKVMHESDQKLNDGRVVMDLKGRPKGGQAFVYLPSTELARVALAGTNGFVYKGKPMIVQYGRNQSTTKTSTSGAAPG